MVFFKFLSIEKHHGGISHQIEGNNGGIWQNECYFCPHLTHCQVVTEIVVNIFLYPIEVVMDWMIQWVCIHFPAFLGDKKKVQTFQWKKCTECCRFNSGQNFNFEIQLLPRVTWSEPHCKNLVVHVILESLMICLQRVFSLSRIVLFQRSFVWAIPLQLFQQYDSCGVISGINSQFYNYKKSFFSFWLTLLFAKGVESTPPPPKKRFFLRYLFKKQVRNTKLCIIQL